MLFASSLYEEVGIVMENFIKEKRGDAANSEKMRLKKGKGWSECSLQGYFNFRP